MNSLKYILNEIGYKVTPLYYHNKNGKEIKNTIDFKILEKMNLRKFVENSFLYAAYEVCVACTKLI